MIENKILFETLRRFAVAKNSQVTKERLQIYCDYLTKKFNNQQSIKALEELFIETKFFPDISEIIKKIENPVNQKEMAVVMANEILEAAQRYNGAPIDLGEEMNFVVSRFGGWSSLAQIKYDEINTARAQLREICNSVLSLKKRGINLNQIDNDKKMVLKPFQETLKELTYE